MNAFGILAVANSKEAELSYIWRQATPEGKAVIVCLVIFSIIAWTVMIGKAIQMRRAKKLNRFFDSEFHTQKNVLDVFDRRVQAEGCPLFMVYQAGSVELDTRLKNPDGNGRKQFVLICTLPFQKCIKQREPFSVDRAPVGMFSQQIVSVHRNQQASIGIFLCDDLNSLFADR